MNQHTLNLVSSWVQSLSSAIVKVSPLVWKTAVAVKQADCIGNLITAALAAAVHLLIILILLVALIKVGTFLVKDKVDWDKAKPWFGSVFVFVSLFWGAINLWDCWSDINDTLLDQWQWIGALHPGLAVAHDIIQKAMGN